MASRDDDADYRNAVAQRQVSSFVFDTTKTTNNSTMDESLTICIVDSLTKLQNKNLRDEQPNRPPILCGGTMSHRFQKS
jgi:hypothetical protein